MEERFWNIQADVFTGGFYFLMSLLSFYSACFWGRYFSWCVPFLPMSLFDSPLFHRFLYVIFVDTFFDGVFDLQLKIFTGLTAVFDTDVRFWWAEDPSPPACVIFHRDLFHRGGYPWFLTCAMLQECFWCIFAMITPWLFHHVPRCGIIFQRLVFFPPLFRPHFSTVTGIFRDGFSFRYPGFSWTFCDSKNYMIPFLISPEIFPSSFYKGVFPGVFGNFCNFFWQRESDQYPFCLRANF